MKKLALLSLFILCLGLAFSVSSCKKKDTTVPPRLIFKFHFDSTATRLNNLGNLATIPAGHAAQSPIFRKMSAHYLELAPGMYTALGAGSILYKADETSAGGAKAIEFEKSTIVGEGDTFFSIPISQVTPGTYEWIRLSLAYQNYDINFKYRYPLDTTITMTGTGTIASFVGYNTYIKTVRVNTQNLVVNANKLQGFWGFETLGYLLSGQAPPGATTVPNPLFASSPIPAGSCVVTAEFAPHLNITGKETKDIVVTCNISTNKSFEWDDSASPDGWYQPDKGDFVVDMGTRGLVPAVQY